MHRQGHVAQAEALYQEIILQMPEQFDALHMLGVIEHQNGRLEQAISLIERALIIEPDYPVAHVNLANALLGLERLQAALASYERASALRPHYAKALYGQGVALQGLNRLEEALERYHAALAAEPAFQDALHNRAIVLKQLGYYTEALADFASVIGLRPDHELSWIGFSECLFSAKSISKEYTRLLLPALRASYLDPQNAQPFALELICREPLVQEWLQLSEDSAACAQRMEAAIVDGRMNAMLEMALLLAVLEETIVTGYHLERVLTALRGALLSLAVRAHPVINGAIVRRFVPALAVQCFANEYLYEESGQERALLAELTAKVSPAAGTHSRPPAVWLGVLGAYRPLHTLDCARELADMLGAEVDYRQLVAQQLREPAREAELKREIPRITRIGDAVSDAVRTQYEENPFPRWRRRRTAEGLPFEVFIKRLFPAHEIADAFPQRPEILVAGCGTGSHSVQTARRVRNARILAVDLSLSSLAYARRASEEAGISNIEYAQADILEISSLKRQFDIIEALGVLHHLADPFAGARVLAGLLRPGGYMYIALYSEAARRDIMAVRDFIRERGYSAAPDDIRRCRRALMSAEYRGPLDGVMVADFFSMSGCRDLLFHVQEHLFTPLRIADFVERLGLEFLGFQLQERATERQYRTMFPRDTARTSLANWEQFEHAHPTAFYGMYIFWLRKPSACLQSAEAAKKG